MVTSPPPPPEALASRFDFGPCLGRGESGTVDSWERRRVQDAVRPEFLRGDTDSDGNVNITDAMGVLSFLFRQGPALLCPDAGDANPKND